MMAVRGEPRRAAIGLFPAHGQRSRGRAALRSAPKGSPSGRRGIPRARGVVRRGRRAGGRACGDTREIHGADAAAVQLFPESGELHYHLGTVLAWTEVHYYGLLPPEMRNRAGYHLERALKLEPQLKKYINRKKG